MQTPFTWNDVIENAVQLSRLKPLTNLAEHFECQVRFIETFADTSTQILELTTCVADVVRRFYNEDQSK